ncbi:MAG: 5'-nucleotidase, lipoprotein e(P4) family [Kofleriaceae bacterium]
MPRPAFVFYAGEGTTVDLEVTHGGTQARLDTLIKVYGPRLADGSYPKTLATDDDSGYGKLSKINDLGISIPGFYLVEVTNGPAATVPTDAKLRLQFGCTGVCDIDAPVAPLGLELRWYQRSAERRALTTQAYRVAADKLQQRAAQGLPANWGVVLDIDETTLNNSAYQRARGELGLGFSPGTWTEWVNKRAATPIDGVASFLDQVRTLGGKVVFVTNRIAASECAQTEENLANVGITYDTILCKTTTSDKNPRFDAVKTGTGTNLPPLDVLMFVGDNIQDFPALTQDIRRQDETAFSAFGETLFVIPNPMYGSWEKNAD